MSTPAASTPPPAPPAPPKKPASAASRYLFVFLVGLVVGIVAVVMLMRTLESRKTWQDHYPDSLMHLMHAQSDQYDMALKANRCTSADLLPRLQSLRSLANDLEPAFPDLREDQRFVGHAGAMRGALDAAIAAPPADCAAAAAAIEKVGESCGGCHQDFKG